MSLLPVILSTIGALLSLWAVHLANETFQQALGNLLWSELQRGTWAPPSRPSVAPRLVRCSDPYACGAPNPRCICHALYGRTRD